MRLRLIRRDTDLALGDLHVPAQMNELRLCVHVNGLRASQLIGCLAHAPHCRSSGGRRWVAAAGGRQPERSPAAAASSAQGTKWPWTSDSSLTVWSLILTTRPRASTT